MQFHPQRDKNKLSRTITREGKGPKISGGESGLVFIILPSRRRRKTTRGRERKNKANFDALVNGNDEEGSNNKGKSIKNTDLHHLCFRLSINY